MGNEESLQQPLTYNARPSHQHAEVSHRNVQSPSKYNATWRNADDVGVRRQDSLLSEADFTDSSENSAVLRSAGRKVYLRSLSGSQSGSQLASSERSVGDKGSILDIIKKLVVTQASFSDDDAASQARELSSTSLQDSACEILDASQRLSEEEKTQIKNVLDRVKQVETRENERLL